MPDYVPTTADSTGSKVFSDELSVGGSTVYAQRTKIALGADGAWDGDLDVGQQASACSLSVVLSSDHAAVAVSGSVALLTGANVIGAVTTIQGQVSASVSGGSVALLAGANAIGAVTTIQGQVSASVSGGSVALLTGANTIGKLASNTGVDIGDVDVLSGPTGANAFQVQGTVAHDGAAANNPFLLAATAAATEPAAVSASGDVVRLIADVLGRLITFPYCAREDLINGHTDLITDTTVTDVMAASTGLRAYVTWMSVTNGGSVSTWVNLYDGSASKLTLFCAGSGGGFTGTLPTPFQTTTGCAFRVGAETAASIRCCAVGFRGT